MDAKERKRKALIDLFNKYKKMYQYTGSVEEFADSIIEKTYHLEKDGFASYYIPTSKEAEDSLYKIRKSSRELRVAIEHSEGNLYTSIKSKYNEYPFNEYDLLMDLLEKLDETLNGKINMLKILSNEDMRGKNKMDRANRGFCIAVGMAFEFMSKQIPNYEGGERGFCAFLNEVMNCVNIRISWSQQKCVETYRFWMMERWNH